MSQVYGVAAPEDLEKKMRRNIGPDLDTASTDGGASQKKPRGGGRRRAAQQDEGEDD